MDAKSLNNSLKGAARLSNLRRKNLKPSYPGMSERYLPDGLTRGQSFEKTPRACKYCGLEFLGGSKANTTCFDCKMLQRKLRKLKPWTQKPA